MEKLEDIAINTNLSLEEAFNQMYLWNNTETHYKAMQIAKKIKLEQENNKLGDKIAKPTKNLYR